MKKYYHFELNMTVMNILSIILFIVPFLLLFLCGYSMTFKHTGILLIGMLFYLLLHELFHAIGYALFARDKNNIKIGITLEKGVLYAACQELISKRAILVSLMMPLVFLSIITFPIGVVFHLDWLIFLSIVNFSGAIGDMLMFILILKCPKDVGYIDYDNSVGAYLVSKQDLSKIKSLGFKIGEIGEFKDKKLDATVKKFFVSKTSIIILTVLILFGIISIVLETV